MRKNGHDRLGRQRWQCDKCKLTAVTRRSVRQREAQLDEFLDWLLEAVPQRKLKVSARAFRKRTTWCWELKPRIRPDGLSHHVIMADGTYLGGWCLLTAIDGVNGRVLAFQWCKQENTIAYQTLFSKISPPDVLVCDGMRGIRGACARVWPTTRIQRCLVHVQRDTRTDLTSRPRLQAGKELKKLADALTRIHDREDAIQWAQALNLWHEQWSTLLAQRTYARDDPKDPRAARHAWWWTHLPLRRAYRRLENLYREGSLFCFLNPTLTAGGPVPRTSNLLEGGLNAPLKRMLVNHRGMPVSHMRRACQWLCYMKSTDPNPMQVLKEYDLKARSTPPQEPETDNTLSGFDTGINWNELHTPTQYPNNTD